MKIYPLALFCIFLFSNSFLFTSSHVQVCNEVGIKFYQKFGFEIVETKESYYKRIEPADAYVLQKILRPKIVNGDAALHNGDKKEGDKDK